MTYPTTTRDDLWVPGSILGGALLKGWCGPIEAFDVWHGDSDESWAQSIWTEWAALVDGDGQPGMFTDAEVPVRLRLTRPEVRRRVEDVLAEGERCEDCGYTAEDALRFGDHGICDGVNRHPRPRYNLTWVTAAERKGEISADHAAGVLHCTIDRVAAGLGPVVKVLRVAGVRYVETIAIGQGRAVIDEDGSLLLPYPSGPRRLVVGD